MQIIMYRYFINGPYLAEFGAGAGAGKIIKTAPRNREPGFFLEEAGAESR